MAEGAATSFELDVFISYSRKDALDFAKQLAKSLQVIGHNPIMDLVGISGAEDWRTRLGQLIVEADTVVFVLSPESAISPVCAWEVEEAVRRSKRIIPVLPMALASDSPPEALRKLNYIHFYADDRIPDSGFGYGLAQLASALKADLEWLREHRKLLVQAEAWEAKDRDPGRLLHGSALADAERWAASRPVTAPGLSLVQQAYLLASREAADAEQAARARALEERERLLREAEAAQERAAAAQLEREAAQRQAAELARREADQARRVARRTFAGAMAALLLAAIASILGFYAQGQRRAAIAQAEAAKAAEMRADQTRDEALLAQSKALTYYSLQHTEKENNPTLGMLLALEALPDPASSDPVAKSRKLWLPAELALGKARRMYRAIGFKPHAEDIDRTIVAPDGLRAATMLFGGSVKIWDVETHADVAKLSCPGHCFTGQIAFSRDSRRLVTTSNAVAHVWDARSGELLFTLRGHTENIGAVTFSRDGTYVVTTGRDKTLRVWSANQGALVKVIELETEAKVLAWGTDDGHVAALFGKATAFDGETTAAVQAVDLISGAGREIMRLEGVGNSALLSRDGSTLVSNDGRQARVMSLSERTSTRTVALGALASSELFGDDYYQLSISPDGHRLAAIAPNTEGIESSVRIWDLVRQTEVQIAVSNKPLGVELVQSQHVALFDTRTSVTGIWNIDPDAIELKRTLPDVKRNAKGEDTILRDMVISGDALTAGILRPDNVIRVLSVETGAEVAQFQADKDAGPALAIDESGRRIVSGGSAVAVWDTATATSVVLLPVASEKFGISADGKRVVTLSPDNRLQVWDASDGTVVRDIAHPSGKVSAIAVSRDGLRIVTIDDKVARFWDVASGTLRHEWKGTDTAFVGAWLPPNGDTVALSSSHGLAIRDLNSGALVRELGVPLKSTSVVEGYVGKAAAVASDAGAAAMLFLDDRLSTRTELWDYTRGVKLADFDVGKAMSAVFGSARIGLGRDYRHLVYLDDSGFLHRLFLAPHSVDLASRTKKEVPRCLTAEERRKFALLPVPPRWCIELEKWPFNTPGASELATELLKDGQDEDAGIYLDVLREKDPRRVDGVLAEGHLAVAENIRSGVRNETTVQRVLELYQKAAALGSAKAMNRLGDGFKSGDYFDRDIEKAVDWYGKAAAMGDASAMENLGGIYLDGVGGSPDYGQARQWLEKAVSAGALGAGYRLGWMTAEGQGSLPDGDNALEWFGKCSDAGYSDCTASIGDLYFNGKVVTKSYPIAREWYAKAVAAGAGWRAENMLFHIDADEATAKGLYGDVLEIRERAAQRARSVDATASPTTAKALPNALGSLSWSAVLAGKPERALSAAEEALKAVPGTLWIETNKAHALMLLRRDDEARAIYLGHVGKMVPESQKLWEEVIREDFAEMRKAGQGHPMMAEIERLLSAGRK